jgi:hypothetical protein
MRALLNNGWVEDVGTWLLGLAVGAKLASVHITRPAKRRHAELILKHDEHETRLAAIERNQGSRAS